MHTKISFQKKQKDFQWIERSLLDQFIDIEQIIRQKSTNYSQNTPIRNRSYILNMILQLMNIPKQKSQEEQQPLESNQKPQPQPQQIAFQYGDNPVSMKCPFCLQHIHSEIILKPQFASVALGICIFVLIPHLIMMIAVILIMQLTASKKHRCPLCERQLGSNGKFLVYFTDEVYSISLFSAGFIFTKKMAMTVGLIVFVFIVLSLRISQMSQDRYVAKTWPEYLAQCGTNDPITCLNRYKDKDFRNWTGYLLRLKDNRQNSHKYYLHAISLFLKMEPPGQGNQPDVLVTLDNEAIFFNRQVLQVLQHGDRVRFNCSLHQKERGNLKDVMHFHISELAIDGHDQNYALYTQQIQEEWIALNIENKGALTKQD